MLIRELKSTDMEEFLDIVKQLSPKSSFGNLSSESVWKQLTSFKKVFVALIDNKIIGTTSVYLEYKVNRGCNPKTGKLYCVAHIEEVVVDIFYRRKGIGRSLMEFCTKFSEDSGAYKIILDCSDENVSFYEKCGYIKYENCMRKDII